MLTDIEVKAFHGELLSCKRPVFLFHDDPDGLASFLLCYRFVGGGRGLPVKAFPRVQVDPFARKVVDYGADKVFVLDIALMDQEFVDAVKVPVVWLDHHDLQQCVDVKYFNPRVRGVNVPTPGLVWQAVGSSRPDDLWIAVAGCVGDWFMPPFAEAFSVAFPDLLPSFVRDPAEALFDSRLGVLIKVFSFVLKGSMSDVLKCVKILTRVNSPYEILDCSSPGGKFLWKRYLAVNKEYESLLSRALRQKPVGGLFVFTYENDALSLTKDVANEVLYRLRDRVVVLGRKKSGEFRCSLRAPAGVNVKLALKRALVGVQGYGGGHERACGCAVKVEDFEVFLGNLRRELNL